MLFINWLNDGVILFFDDVNDDCFDFVDVIFIIVGSKVKFEREVDVVWCFFLGNKRCLWNNYVFCFWIYIIG